MVSANGLDDDANREPRAETRDELHDRASSRRLIGAIVGIGAAGLLVTGVVKLIVHPDDHERIVTTAWQLQVTSDGFSVLGRF